jgi:hypothetical protein
METLNPNPISPQEPPADPGTEQALRRGLLAVAVIALLAPCGLCWYSTTLEAVELVLIPGILGLVAAGYTIYRFYQREQKQDLAPPLWRALLVFSLLALATGLALWWLLAMVGWRNGAGIAILVLGAWALILSGRRVWEAWSFSRQAVEEETDQVELEMVSIGDSHPIYPRLVYHYAGNYRGQLQNEELHHKIEEIRPAVSAGTLRVRVVYLPEDPRVHRVTGWRIV